MEKQLPISVCMSMHNVAPYVGECIDSILAQTFEDFELLIVDDGSDDNSAEIVRSYTDKRIKLIERKHDYIASLNYLLNHATGKYIARMDADDRMPADRLRIQYEYMEKHPEVDILGGGMTCFGEKEGDVPPYCIGDVGYLELIDCCGLYHPTVLIRRSRLEEVGMAYRPSSVYAEDYSFWVDSLIKGLKMRNVPDVFSDYRLHPTQVTRNYGPIQWQNTIVVKDRLAKAWFSFIQDYLQREEPIRKSDKPLTVIIPFYNEGAELKNTVESVRATAGDAVDIIVINDGSDDGIDYEKMLQELDVTHIVNPYRLGPAATKEKGVQCCQTPYFILLDAHVRFYQSDWVSLLVHELLQNPSQIICCQTKTLKLEHGEVIEKEADPTYGAFIYWGMNKYTPMSMWNPNPSIKSLKTGHIPCILGACYASSKKYWNRIQGYRGLLGYGCEEPFVSMKAWMEGGKCLFMPNIVVGHIYKDYSPHSLMRASYVYNFLFIADLLLPTSQRCKVFAVLHSMDAYRYNVALILLKASASFREDLRSELLPKLQNADFDYIRMINYVVHPDAEQDLEVKCQMLPQILDYCQQRVSYDSGLYEGKAGLMLFLLLYYGLTHDIKHKSMAISLLQDIGHSLSKANSIPFTFSHGLLGIGWSLLYLADYGLLRYDEVQGMLARIDQRISFLSPRRMKADLSLATGYTGLVAYVTARLGICQRYGKSHAISGDLLDEMKTESGFCIENYGSQMDNQAYSLHLLMSLYGEERWCTAKMEFSDVCSLPTYIPQNEAFWSMNLTAGCLGYAIHLIITKNKINENK